MEQSITTTDFAKGLRALADFYEAHPEMPLPCLLDHRVYIHDRDSFLRSVKMLATGGTVTKKADDADSSWPQYHAIRMFGPVALDLSVDRKLVCRMIRPAQPAVFECPDSLLEEAAEYLEGK